MTAITPGTTRLGFIGLGVMGSSMCRNLMEAGYGMTVFTRTKATADEAIAAGATWADTPRAVAEASDVCFAIVGYPDDVRHVFLGDEGLLAGASDGDVLVDMTTSEPSLAVEIAAKAAEKDVAAIDAPVSGGDIGAKNGTLSIMIGGDDSAVQRLDPLWNLMGQTIVHQGGPGAGQHCKVVNQTLNTGIMVSLCEALVYAVKAGLDPETVLQSVSKGAAGSWALSNLAPRVLKGDFEPGFYVEHFLKDIGIALAEAKRMNLSLPGLALAEQLYQSTAANGGSRKGTQALAMTIARLSNVDLTGT